MIRYWLLAWLCFLFVPAEGLRSTMTYHPQGANPLLYTPGLDSIMHLDQNTFDDTVFDQTKSNSFMVEFYADWCGFCRAFVPFYRDFAQQIAGWSDVTKVAAINCADSFNAEVCRRNSVTHFPMVKYFPRLSTTYSDAQQIEPSHSVVNLRDQLASKIINEFNHLHYMDWPNFRYIDVTPTTRFEDLWLGIPLSTQYMAIIFEQFDSVASQAILDLWKFRQYVGVRRAMANSPLTSMLSIQTFPYVALFRRGDQQSLFMSQYHSNVLQEILNRVQSGQQLNKPTQRPPLQQQTKQPSRTINCTKQPDRCAPLYFVSETDMLKAMRQALLDEVIRANEHIRGSNFTSLYNFVSLLADNFPTSTLTNDVRRRATIKRAANPQTLRRSENARAMFVQMRRELDTKPQTVSSKEWKTTFEAMERQFNNPFPVEADWQHCKGSGPEYRGYTCGLWTTFHTITIQAYTNMLKNKKPSPMQPLKAIQGWVNSFFGCQDCRMHFMEMTTQKFPMTAQRVRQPHDTFMYLWRAHNIVNNRLHKDITEDPQFLKYQFPPLFLCPTCHAGGQFSRRKVRNFLLQYYMSIRPFHRIHSH
ncbi:Sulfhydryl oxidase [Aphelenchoides bicaudatus]|nr:Sulfhydryl oxidase [Aphelenchoides bicaudatus]